MEERFISDRYFLPSNISHYSRHNEFEEGLYQMIYGILRDDMTYDDIYNLIAGICQEQKAELVMKFKLIWWEKEIKAIIKKLSSIDVGKYQVWICIPFTRYLDDIPNTLQRLEFVLFTFKNFIEDGCYNENVTLPEFYPLRTIKELLEDYILEFSESLPLELKADIPYYESIMYDEMLRRDINDSRGSVLTQSEYYNTPAKFFEFSTFIGGDKILNIKTRKETTDNDVPDFTSEDGITAKEKAGILYYMLKSLLSITIDKKSKKKIVSLINFCLNKPYNYDTTRRYIDDFPKIPDYFPGQKFFEVVNEKLKEYKFDVPKEIKEEAERK